MLTLDLGWAHQEGRVGLALGRKEAEGTQYKSLQLNRAPATWSHFWRAGARATPGLSLFTLASETRIPRSPGLSPSRSVRQRHPLQGMSRSLEPEAAVRS